MSYSRSKEVIDNQAHTQTIQDTESNDGFIDFFPPTPKVEAPKLLKSAALVKALEYQTKHLSKYNGKDETSFLCSA